MNRRIHIILGPLAAVLCASLMFLNTGLDTKVIFMTGVAIWMAWWWMTEVLPMALTAMLPMLLLPLLGIASAKDTGRQYMDSILFLYIGGFILAFALEKWHLHKRIAYIILNIAGTKPTRILLGVMITSYTVSMWISNTAAVMMLLAAVLALTKEMQGHYTDEKQQRNISVALLIGLAYSASIGGMATLVGTPTNMIFYREYLDKLSDRGVMDFFEWAKMGVPVSLFLLLVAFHTLRLLFYRNVDRAAVAPDYFRMKLKELGPLSAEERRVAGVFFLTVILWFTRADIDFGFFTFHGWSNLLRGYEKFADDSTVAVIAALLLFIIPASGGKGKLMQWKDAERLPFEIILLFGGGFALAFGFEESGLSELVAGGVATLHIHPLLIVLTVVTVICVISEFASNVATIQLMIPLLISGFMGSDIPVFLVLVPATLAASLGFMMPIATPPNTIVYGARIIHARELARVGLVMNIVGIAAITLLAALLYWSGYYAG